MEYMLLYVYNNRDLMVIVNKGENYLYFMRGEINVYYI